MSSNKYFWFTQAHQWMGLSLAFILLVLIAALWMLEYRLHYTQDIEHFILKQEIEQKEVLDERKVRMSQYDEMWELYHKQRDQAVAEIQNYQQELDILVNRTKGLEEVQTKLKELDIEMEDFRNVEKEFIRLLELLEGPQGT